MSFCFNLHYSQARSSVILGYEVHILYRLPIPSFKIIILLLFGGFCTPQKSGDKEAVLAFLIEIMCAFQSIFHQLSPIFTKWSQGLP